MHLWPFTMDPFAFAKNALLTATGGIAVSLFLLYKFQEKIIYPSYVPSDSRKVVDMPDKFGLPFENVELTTPDNEKLPCFLIKQPEEIAGDRPTILMLHGNAGNIGHRLPIAQNLFLHPQIRANIFMLSYRGYGKSTGTPSEKGFNIDAQCALDYLVRHPIIGKSSILPYGQSIGGAVAVSLAARNQDKISGLILENTFTSLAEMIPIAVPLARHFAFLCHQYWPSIKTIEEIKSVPILFVSGDADEIVPPQHMRFLYNVAGVKENMKEFCIVKGGMHMDTCMRNEFYEHLAAFVRRFLRVR